VAGGFDNVTLGNGLLGTKATNQVMSIGIAYIFVKTNDSKAFFSWRTT